MSAQEHNSNCIAKQGLLNPMTIIHCWKIIKSTSGFKRVANLANMVYYKLMTVLYVRITGLLMYMYLKIVSSLNTNVKMDVTEPMH